MLGQNVRQLITSMKLHELEISLHEVGVANIQSDNSNGAVVKVNNVDMKIIKTKRQKINSPFVTPNWVMEIIPH